MPSGKDPLATFLTQIRRSPVVRSTTSPGMCVLDLEFPRRARERREFAPQGRECGARRSSRRPGPGACVFACRRRAQLADEIWTLERQLDEARRSLGEAVAG